MNVTRRTWAVAAAAASVVLFAVFLATGAKAWHGWSWHFWDAFVAIGTLALAAVTFRLVTVTRSSVDAAARQITLERRIAEANQWPRVVPAPSADWSAARGKHSTANVAPGVFLPVTNLGPGVAVNIYGTIQFSPEWGERELLPTSLAAGESREMEIRWSAAIKPPASEWDNCPGKLIYTDIAGRLWQTAFVVQRVDTDRKVLVKETQLLKRANGDQVVMPASLDPSQWYESEAT